MLKRKSTSFCIMYQLDNLTHEWVDRMCNQHDATFICEVYYESTNSTHGLFATNKNIGTTEMPYILLKTEKQNE